MKLTITKVIMLLLSSLFLAQCAAPMPVPTTESGATAPATDTESAAGGTLAIVTNEGTQSFTLDELKAALTTATVTIDDDPVYKRAKTYEGFWLTELLDYANLLDESGDMILFRAADGYEARLDPARLTQTQPQGLVAFRDVEAADGWEPFTKGRSEIVPTPFYLVWAVTEAGSDVAPPTTRHWPWSYQLTTIEMIDFATTYDRLYPADMVQETAVYQGFRLFTDTCVKCHSLNLQGGTQGPELNIPQNITEYRDRETLTAFIKNPTSFRLGSKMPAMETKLTADEIDNILTYIAWMGDHKWSADQENTAHGTTDEDVHWGYEGETGPAAWHELDEAFALCNTGVEQSPINLTAATPVEQDELVFNYAPSTLEVLNNGHTIQVNQDSTNHIAVDGEVFNLLQFHMHAPSEHTVDGRSFPMELHLVHQNEAGQLAVIGLLIAEGAENRTLATLWEHLPNASSEAQMIDGATIDIAALLPDNRSAFRYMGSLTTPPCTEQVRWFVLTTPITLSAEQIAAFTTIHEGNNRPVQPLNARTIQVD